MNYSMIRYILCSVLGFEGLFLLLPALVGAIYGEKEGLVYLAVAAASLLLGMLGRIKKPKSSVFYSREGFSAVSLSWIVLSLVGAVPLRLTGEFPSYVDALFETISGFTTTGASGLLRRSGAVSLTGSAVWGYWYLLWRSYRSPAARRCI